MGPVSEEQLDAAINKRKDYVLQNLHTLTMKQFRGLLERDLSLPKSALKGIKDIVQTKVDEVVSAHEAKEGGQEEALEAKVCCSKTVTKRQEEKPREKPWKKQKREGAAEAGPAAVSGPREYSKRVQKTRAICRQAGIAIPPNVYSKHKTDTSLEGALEGLLEKHGLHRKSTQAEIAAAHRRLQKEKDMEGIDISNIVEGGRRARNRVDYSTVLKPKYEDISEDSGSPQEDDKDDGSIDGSEEDSEGSNRENIRRGNGAGEKRKQLGKRRQQEESEEEGTGSPEEQQQDSSGSDADAHAGHTKAGNSNGKKAAEQHFVKSPGQKEKQAAEQKLIKSPSTIERRASEQKGVKSPEKTKTTEQNHVKSPGNEKKRAAEQNGVKSPVAQTQSPALSPMKLSAKKALSTAEKPPKRQMLADWSDDE